MSNVATTHVALFMPNLAGGGAERMMVNLAAEFERLGARVTLVLASTSGKYGHLLGSSIEVVDLGRSSVITALPGLTAYLRREKPNALLVTLDHASVTALVANALAGRRAKVFVRQACVLTAAERPSLRERILPWVQRVAYPFAERVIAVSNGVAEDVHRTLGLAQNRIVVVANPVVTDDLDSLAQQPSGHPWLDTPGAPVVLGAGRLTRQKDFLTLIRAFSLVRESRDAKLVILGEGPMKDELAAEAERLSLTPWVSLPGFAGNPFAFMRRASVFALSSRWEGLPGVLVQAMACGCPVVSTDCPSGPADVLRGGALGALVPVEDHRALGKAILASLATPADPAALRKAVEQYSATRSGARYFDILTGAE